MNQEIIQSIINCKTENISIYQNAFIHKSALKDTDYSCSNERLEFLGDSVLGLITTNLLYELYPDEQEGFLTKQKTKLVNGKTLSLFAKRHQFDRFIVMDDRGLSKEWNNNTKILENTFEAFVGSLYIDKGFEFTKQWLENILRKEIQKDNFLENTNYKEQVIRLFKNTNFVVSNQIGKENDKCFVIQLLVENKVISEGYGSSKKDAEQDASRKCLVCFNKVKNFSKYK